MDLLAIKAGLALALVESIFRRAGFTLAAPGRREVPPHLGREDLPDFIAQRPPAEDAPGRHVEVRYRLDLAHYLAIEQQRGSRSMFAQAKRHWPDLVVVFVTDHPEAGRSAFQALDLARWQHGQPLVAIDLFAHPELVIYRQNVAEHEVLLRRMVALLAGGP